VPDATPVVDFFQEPVAEARAADANVADVIAASVGQPPQVPPVAASTERPAPGAPAPALVTAAGGARKALCVGIDQYGAPYDLAGCVNDAMNWAKRLRALEFDVTTLHDRAASRGAILDSFGSLVRSARPGDVIVFQFAGHGTQVDDLDRDEDDSLDEAFCPADFAEGRLLIDDDIRAVVAGLQPGVNLTCFIDCCHSGTITRALVPGGRPPSVPPGSRARYIPYSRDISNLHRAFRESGTATVTAAEPTTRGATAAMLKEVCFSACQPHEVAYETAGAGQFTTRAMTVLTPGANLTNVAFMEQVVAAFGANAAQHPHLDCAEEAKKHPLLGRVGVPARL
jgi:hypothetical protein